MPEGERRLAAIMFTDMVGYTALGQRNESLSLALVDQQRQLVRSILKEHNGREVKTMGDAFLVEFKSALDAVKCAFDIQKTTRMHNESVAETERLHLRVGVHLGDIVETEGDVSGDTVNVASRIQSLAEEGGVCVTRQVYDQVQNKFELPLTSLGRKNLKNVSAPVEVYRMAMPWENNKIAPASSFGFSPATSNDQFRQLNEHFKGLDEQFKGLSAALANIPAKEAKSLDAAMEVFKSVTGQDLFPKTEEKPASRSEKDERRIAVLPLTSMSPDSRDEYFADGMTEELISTLSRIAGLRVIARTSVARYKATTKPIIEIGRELAVNNILEGSVRKSGNKIRITAQLIDAITEEHLWAQDYDRDFDDVFTVQSDIAKRITDALSVIVLKNESLRLEKKATGVPAAYSLYLKGRHAAQSRMLKGLKTAVRNFEAAIKKDPGFALAYTGLADAYSTLALLEFVPPREVFPKARLAAEKALALDDRVAESHVSLGMVLFQYEWDWQGAESEFKRALELNPGYAPAHQYYADYLKAMGRFGEALDQMSQAQSLDPLSLAINTGVGHVLYLSRQYDRSIEQYRKVVESDPDFVPARLWFGRPYMLKGMYDEAIEQLEEAVKLSKESTVSLAMLGQAYASAGQRSLADKVLNKLLERSRKQYVPSYWIALIQMSMGNKKEAFEWLERAYHERSSWLVWMNVEPRFDQLRSDPRFGSITSRMRLVEAPPKN